ncbi:MAG TPA: helix-turn-helix domain-containing protein [Candidatus Kryptonia bacterium]
MASKVLIVDDDELLNNSLNAVLTRRGYEDVSVIKGGNQIQAAKILGLTRSRLRYRMQQLRIKYEPKKEASAGSGG